MCWVKNVQWRLASKEYKNNITEKSAKKLYAAKKPYANGEQVLKDFQHYCNSFLSPTVCPKVAVSNHPYLPQRGSTTLKKYKICEWQEPCLFFSVITQVTSSYLPWNSYDTRRKCGCGSQLWHARDGHCPLSHMPACGWTNKRCL